MLSNAFRTFFDAQGSRLDCTAHSHHPWPDIALQAHNRYALDSMRFTNEKWPHILGETIPCAQELVAREIGWPNAADIAFAPNTHEFVLRLLSCLPQLDASPCHHIVTSSHEFYSFDRQVRRLEESGRLSVSRVDASPWGDFTQRFISTIERERPAMVYVSHVFFDSSFTVQDLEKIIRAAKRVSPECIVAIDGYHAFCALPMNLSEIASEVFYLAGGYKYAMAGEGVCWMAVPHGSSMRPENTGWFADYDGQACAQLNPLAYKEGGMRFWGATFDASGLYRFIAVREWLHDQGITTAMIHAHVYSLQMHFLEWLGERNLDGISANNLVPPLGVDRGNFLSFHTPQAGKLDSLLKRAGISVDHRDTYLRLGFGVYHDRAFVERLTTRLDSVLA